MILYIVLFTLVAFLFFFNGRRNHPKFPPGNRGWPVVGAIPSFKISLLDQIEEKRKQFGNIFSWRIGSRDFVFLCDPAIIKKALTNPLLGDRPRHFFTFDTWSNNMKTGLVNNNGLSWQTHRRFVLRNLRDSGFGKSVAEDIIHAEAESLIQDVKNNFLNTPAETPQSINVATLNVIWKLAADIRFDREDEHLQSFIENMINVTKEIQGMVNIFDIFPWIVPLTPSWIFEKTGFYNLEKSRNSVKTYLRSIISNRKKMMKRESPQGIIDSYLLEMEEKGEHDTFDEESLMITLGDLFFAGSDTSARTIRWVLLTMASHPEIQCQVQEEIDAVVNRDTLPKLADKPKLPLTEAVITESLRIAHLAPLAVFHAAHDDTTIEQYFIPKDTIVTPFLYRCHTDSSLWHSPLDFDPKHFIDQEGRFKPNSDFFMPFSTGRRACLGENLARSELFLFSSALLQNFTFHVPEGESFSLKMSSDSVIFALLPDHKIIIKERK